MTGFNGGLALTGVEGAVLLVLLVLFVREGGCAACGGAGLCACCDCLDESLRRPADADVLCGAECGDGVVCFESASVCLSWAPSKAWRTSSSFSGVSMGVLSGCGCSASESSGANSEATGSGIGTGMGVGMLTGDFLAPYLLSSIDMGVGMMKMLNGTPIDYLTWGNHEAWAAQCAQMDFLVTLPLLKYLSLSDYESASVRREKKYR
eukprot:symbB.v1.2.017134.t1/scaffold1268.1/size213459/15